MQLPIYAITDEVRLGEKGPWLDMSDVETLLALTELEGPSTAIRSRRWAPPGYLYHFNSAPIVFSPRRGMNLLDVYNRAFRTDTPNQAPGENYLLARFSRTGSEPEWLHPTLRIHNEAARVVREMLSRSQDAVMIRLVRGGNPFDYHLSLFNRNSGPITSDPDISMGDDEMAVLTRANFGTVLARFSLPNQLGVANVENDLVTIKDMIDLGREFHDRITGMNASNTNN